MKEMQYETDAMQYAKAMCSLKFAKNILWLLVAVAILAQIFCFAMVNFVGAIDDVPGIGVIDGEKPDKDEVDTATGWLDAIQWILPASKFLGLIAAILLVMVLSLSMKIGLLGRLAGIPGLVSAFLWSLILLALVIPWQVIGGEIIRGTFYNLGTLIRETAVVQEAWGAKDVSWFDNGVYYARMIAMPAVAMLVWLMIQFRFGMAWRAMTRPTSPESQIQEQEPVIQ